MSKYVYLDIGTCGVSGIRSCWNIGIVCWRSDPFHTTSLAVPAATVTIEYKTISTTYKVLHSSSPHYLRDIITIQPSRSTRSSSLVTLLHPQAQSSLKITNRSFRYAAPHLYFLHLFAFLVSRPPQSALLHCQAPTLLLNRWLACLTGSSILVLKLTFSPDPFPVTFLSLSLTDWFHGFYPARVRKSLALKILVSAAD